MTDRILRIADVKTATGLGRSTIYRMIGNKQFPAPIKLSQKAVGWPESIIQRWISQRIKDSHCGAVNS